MASVSVRDTSSAYEVMMDLTGPQDIPPISELLLTAMARGSIAEEKSNEDKQQPSPSVKY